MRLTVFLLLVSAVSVFANKSYSQSKTLNLNMREASVKEVLNTIEEQSEFYFLYSENLIDVERKVDVTIENKKIEQTLNILFKDTDVDYSVRDRIIVLTTPELQDQASVAVQQQKSIKGKVTDTSGEPLPGVTVLVKGTTNGTVTNVDGEYTLKGITAETTLQFSFVGMKTQEIEVGNQTSLDIAMEVDAIGLEEVVAIGYGTMKKSDLTGSVVSIDMEDKDMGANVNVAQALQGYFPGINVGAASEAGGQAAISIRGQTSLSATDAPLIVLDGIIFNGTLTDINVNDIEKIDVLKDASAAAVYGSRSANGVIIVTTKRGTAEKPTISFNMSYGFQEMANTNHKIMNGEQYALRMVDYYYQQELQGWYRTNPTNATGRPVRPDVTDRNVVAERLRSNEERDNYLAGNEIDWLDEVTRHAPVQNYSVNVAGKTDKTNYFLSGTYTDQTGVTIEDDFKRYTLRANFENKITDWFSMGLNTSYSFSDMSGRSTGYFVNRGRTNLLAARSASPWGNMYDELGNYPLRLANESAQQHPLRNKLVDDEDKSKNVFIAANAKIDIPFVKGLKYEFSYANTIDNRKHNTFFPPTVDEGSGNNGRAFREYGEDKTWMINNIISYDRTFADIHTINATLLYTAEEREGETSTMRSEGFDNYNLGYNAMQMGSVQSLESGAWEESSTGFMARVNYSYKNRYLLTGTFRRDGYSGFGANEKYANFPSVSAGWTISEENFMGNVNWLDQLKLRVSYGVNGNQGIGRYSSLSRLQSKAYVYGPSTSIGLYAATIGNSDLKWEKTGSLNVGLNFAILGQRIMGEVDMYKSKTEDVLVERSLPSAMGYKRIWENIGGLKNKGLELAIDSRNIVKPNFKWSTKFLFSINRNEISKLYGDIHEDLENGWFVGESINAIYDYQVQGVWQESDLFSGNIHNGYYPGQYKLQDLNGDNDINQNDDRSVIGYEDPNYRFGISNNLSYKNLSLSFFINSIQGGNGYYMANSYSSVVSGGTDGAYRQNQSAVRPYWTPDNPVNNAPGFYYAPKRQHGVYEDKSFVRLQDVTVQYTFSKSILNKIGFSNLQVYLSGKNLYTWTDWSGWDPETVNPDPNNSSPMMRSFISGVKLSF